MSVARSASEAIQVLRDSSVDCIISSYVAVGDSPRVSTLELLVALRAESMQHHVSPLLVFGAERDNMPHSHREEATRLGARCWTSYYYELLSKMAEVLEDIAPTMPVLLPREETLGFAAAVSLSEAVRSDDSDDD
jgi:hypothetical protein|eukprot:39977-Prymnesium_polylepis.1